MHQWPELEKEPREGKSTSLSLSHARSHPFILSSEHCGLDFGHVYTTGATAAQPQHYSYAFYSDGKG